VTSSLTNCSNLLCQQFRAATAFNGGEMQIVATLRATRISILDWIGILVGYTYAPSAGVAYSTRMVYVVQMCSSRLQEIFGKG